MAENNSDRDLEVDETNNKFNKTNYQLAVELEELKNFVFKKVHFVQVPNKWKFFVNNRVCWEFTCVNSNSSKCACDKGNGFIQLIDDENIKYIKCEQSMFGWIASMFGSLNGMNKLYFVVSENTFNKPTNDCSTFTSFYFEVKIKFENENKDDILMVFGLIRDKEMVYLSKTCDAICYGHMGQVGKIPFPSLTFNDGDTYGCGIIYSPTKMTGISPTRIFITQNGQLIGKAIKVKDDNNYTPWIRLKLCSVETNFGNDLTTKPFKYDISKHIVTDEFYN
uniref:Uncharacterized protein n=1 Tax=Meloidogyne enterolobii TaxID=390850 RepID=A0A6V7XVP0_MELEN|nr:unnamed protein product [Meloidogyne enterolobii]